ncbi:PTS glucose transporter subunit IIBC [Photobacterium frigidiphilum]|uniref:PTS system glucose-specific EIICB component n=1 Tax=Photobacterium frigidiphilum TaxID=264736 RepID=A0A2T3JMN2_9GAMM|nr:glucose-specific PTS transporter subunit IIBC [Photobacterium frigidiphilum]PSU50294.1 PTS glucose transporter subunit IIBC [Photobacterium frigidiphilum]
MNIFSTMQKMGRSLMLPVACMPAAGILLGIGGNSEVAKFLPDIVAQIMTEAGLGVFANMALLFAIGVALGFTKNDGVAALAATLGYLTMTRVLGVVAEGTDTGVFGGVIMGLVAAQLFNKYHDIKLPTYLGFFGGKRFVPIVTSLAACVVAGALALIWQPIGAGIAAFSEWAAYQSPEVAFGIYGIVERSLIPFGLHHIWNAPFFYEVGEFTTAAGEVVKGEIPRYLAGDPTAGNLAGGYMFKMFGLPAACLAMYVTAKKENKLMVASILGSAALTSFLTGITEPIEFAFLFVAPVLYVAHALLAGSAFVVMILLGIKHGTTFSHGLFDFTLLFGQSTNGWLLPVIGLVYAVIYFLVFVTLIKALDLKTPGREDKEEMSVAVNTSKDGLAQDIAMAFGGKENIKDLEACITRLRVTVFDSSKVDIPRLKALGAAGVFAKGDNYQAVFGTHSEIIKGQIEVLA